MKHTVHLWNEKTGQPIAKVVIDISVAGQWPDVVTYEGETYFLKHGRYVRSSGEPVEAEKAKDE